MVARFDPLALLAPLTPIPLTNDLQVTTDPAGKQHPIQESTGQVPADSLAAESSREAGAFSSNPNAAPSGVPAAKSTVANTDTSAATQLDSAPDANAREAREAWGESAALKGPGGLKYDEGVGGQPKFGGQVSDRGYSGGPAGTSAGASGSTGGGASTGGSASYASAAGSGSGSTSAGESYSGTAGSGSGGTSGSGDVSGGSGGSVDQAPSYATSVVQGGDGKPKGKNLQEGGFDGAEPNTDYEIGDKNDPGRAALNQFQERNEASAGGTGPVQREIDNQTTYDALKGDEQI